MILTRLKAGLRHRFMVVRKAVEEDKEAARWQKAFPIKILYALMFFLVAEVIYQWWADHTLTAMMAPQPLLRSEQFTLSLLLHYPQYLLWSIQGGLCAVLALHWAACLMDAIAASCYRRLCRNDRAREPEKRESTHD